jgi:predicted aspartyl protease
MGIIIYPPDRAEIEIECVVDTDFEGFLTLPPTVVAE